ncbi:hypothetical protein G6F68_015682 [Rhizopus microsporus]|nr:hypothetical protein G6F68_015682 [Rhizopus microsporus]
MEGALGDRVNGLVDEFNKKNPDYQVKEIYKGNYGESMNAGIAAFRAGNAPDILQVFEVGTATMMYAKGAIKPVQQMSEEVGNPIDPKEFIGAVAGYYSSADGKLVSMPFNSSTVVFYYNKDAFKNVYIQDVLSDLPGGPKLTWVYDMYKQSYPDLAAKPGHPQTPPARNPRAKRSGRRWKR